MKQFTLRIPDYLYERLADEAAVERRSLNNQILIILDDHYDIVDSTQRLQEPVEPLETVVEQRAIKNA